MKKFLITILVLAIIITPYLISEITKTYVILNKGEKLSYYNGKTFQQTDEIANATKKRSFFYFLKNFLLKIIKENETIKYKYYEPSIPLQKINPSNIRVYYINHSTFLIQTATKNILTDPIYSDIAGVWKIGPKRLHNPGINFKDLPKIDIVLISHNHYDHMDKQTIIDLYKKHNPLFIVPLGNKKLVKSFHKDINVIELKLEETHSIDNYKITLERANHYSRRGLFDKNKMLWGSYAIETQNNHKIFFAGDTAFNNGTIFKNIGKKYKSFDIALLPIGAYQPNEFLKSYHTNPNEAVLIHKLINSNNSIGMHTGTFKLGQDTKSEAVKDLEISKFKNKIHANKFTVLDPGEFIEIKKN